MPRESLRHRIAISERRILGFDDERVRFSSKDYRDGNREKVMDLEADEFLRRYLLHVLPERFVRIRYFGFLANRVRSRNLELAREQLAPSRFRATCPRLSRTHLLPSVRPVASAR